MKATSLKSALFALLLVTGLSFTSCKDKDATKDANAIDTTSTEMEDPTADTVTTVRDTVTSSTDTVTNPVGP